MIFDIFVGFIIIKFVGMKNLSVIVLSVLSA